MTRFRTYGSADRWLCALCACEAIRAGTVNPRPVGPPAAVSLYDYHNA